MKSPTLPDTRSVTFSQSHFSHHRSAAMNLFANVPTKLPSELVDVLAEGQSVRIERIVSTGHNTQRGVWYDQDQDEWVVVLQGEAKLSFDDGDLVTMKPGDHLLIAAHRRHRVEWTTPNDPTLWLAVFFGNEPKHDIETTMARA